MLKTDKEKEEAKHEEELQELMEKHGKELQDLGEYASDYTKISQIFHFPEKVEHFDHFGSDYVNIYSHASSFFLQFSSVINVRPYSDIVVSYLIL